MCIFLKHFGEVSGIFLENFFFFFFFVLQEVFWFSFTDNLPAAQIWRRNKYQQKSQMKWVSHKCKLKDKAYQVVIQK